MEVERIVPDIQTQRPKESREFYTGLLGLSVVMDLDWIVTLASPVRPHAQVSLITHDAGAPVVPQVTIEVADVDQVYAEAVRRGERIVHPLTDESWGVRRFFVQDPDGTVVNVMGHLP